MSALAQAQSHLMRYLVDNDAPPPSRGHAVYHHAYRARLQGALAEAYPRLNLWIGDAGFARAAETYIDAHPSASWTLNTFGAGMHKVLGGLYPDDPEVADLAWLDWALHSAFSGPDAPDFDPTSLATADWETAGLAFVPTLAFRPVVSNAAAIWQALSRAETPPAVQSLGSTAVLVVWRHGLEPKFRTIDADEARAIKALQDGLSFAALCDTLQAPDGQTPSDIAGQWLVNWIADGRLAAVTS